MGSVSSPLEVDDEEFEGTSLTHYPVFLQQH